MIKRTQSDSRPSASSASTVALVKTLLSALLAGCPFAWPNGIALEASTIAFGRQARTAEATDAASQRSPLMMVTFGRSAAGTLSGLRTNAETAQPCIRARSTTSCPALPVAPKTNIARTLEFVMVGTSILSSIDLLDES